MCVPVYCPDRLELNATWAERARSWHHLNKQSFDLAAADDINEMEPGVAANLTIRCAHIYLREL